MQNCLKKKKEDEGEQGKEEEGGRGRRRKDGGGGEEGDTLVTLRKVQQKVHFCPISFYQGSHDSKQETSTFL